MGTFMYYVSAVEPTILVTVNIISTDQGKTIQETTEKGWWNFSTMQPPTRRKPPDTTTAEIFYTSTTTHILSLHHVPISEQGYINIWVLFRKNQWPPPHMTPSTQWRHPCGMHIPESAMKAELGSLFINCQYGASPRISLDKINNQQPL